MARSKKNDPPYLLPGEEIGGEITVGGSQHRTAIPRIFGARAVENFKSMWGVCVVEGCTKLEGHEGDH